MTDTLSKTNLDNVFHAYDIRAIDIQELDEEFYFKLGQAFVKYLKAKNIALGYDFRPNSAKYQKAMAKGAMSLGCNVVDIGLIATEMLYFAVGSNAQLDGGAVVTASHNPSKYNGCKMVSKAASALSIESGLEQIKQIMLANDFEQVEPRGTISTKDIYPDFKAKILSFLRLDFEAPKVKIIVDAGNGIGGKIFDYVFEGLGLNYEKMYFEPDASFPNHVPNPMEDQNIHELRSKMLKSQSELGIAIDGDADRVFFLDSKGRNPSGIYTGAIFAKYFLKQNPGAKIIQDPRIVWPVSAEVKKSGGKTIMVQAGHSFFKKKMKEEDAIFGAEASSHFFYRDYYYADSGMLTIVTMLNMIFEGMDVDQTYDYYYTNYPNSGEINFEVENAQDTITGIQKYFEENHFDIEISTIDGVSIESSNWRFNLRPSNTQPVIRLNIEGKSEEEIKKVYQILSKGIGGKRLNDPNLKSLM